MNKIRVLVVDDSAYMRQVVSRILSSDADLDVVGTAKDGSEALLKVEELKPDCITLDMEMPKMDGLQTVQALMDENPVPVVLLTSLSRNNEKVIQALEEGAVDFFHKPGDSTEVEKLQKELVGKVKEAAKVPAIKLKRKPVARMRLGRLQRVTKKNIVLIASSTGGPGALWQVIPMLPEEFPLPVIVTQHMPEGFTSSLAERLAKQSKLPVKETEDKEEIKTGTVYIGKGGMQIRIKEDNGKKILRLTNEESKCFVAPSADFLFSDAAALYGRSCLAVVLTGMGEDGLEGAREVKAKGGTVIAQDEGSSIVYGMPKAVAQNNLADVICSIDLMAEKIVEMV